MSSSFDLPEVDHLTAGAIGPPGERVFYLQAASAGHVVSLRLEKTQVAALCRYLEAMLADLPPPTDLPDDLDLVEPVVAEWVVGSLGISYDESADRVVLVAEEVPATAGDDEPDPLAADPQAEPARARFGATREQVAALVAQGAEIVEAGRPRCPLCGSPIDADGHVCVRMNGHRDHTS